MKVIIISLILFISVFAQANRLLEIEDYYTQKVSDYLKMRYPSKAFSVIVSLNTGEQSRIKDKNNQALPYLDNSNSETSFWDRKDLSVGTLISYLESVKISISIDSDLSDQDLNVLKMKLFDKLKLSNVSDSIIVTKKLWSQESLISKRNLWLTYAGAALAVFFLFFFITSKMTVRSLVKGLSEPIAEIGKSTQSFADNAMNLASSQAAPAPQEDSFTATKSDSLSTNSSVSSTAFDDRRIIKELLESTGPLFNDINVELMNLLEKEGKKDPAAMGSILVELPHESMGDLFKYGSGKWWYKAIAQPGELSSNSLEILKSFSLLKVRKNFIKTVLLDSEISDLAILINRLSIEEFSSLIENNKFNEMLPILNLLPKEKSMMISKDLYPGEWGKILDLESNNVKINMTLAKDIRNKILKTYPLRDLNTMSMFFTQLDFTTYLNLSTTKDERDFYKSLPGNSRIKKDRIAYYSFFEQDDEFTKKIVLETSIKQWAILLKACERYESDRVFSHFTDKQKFLIRQTMSKTNLENYSDQFLISVREDFLCRYQKEVTYREYSKNNTKSEAA